MTDREPDADRPPSTGRQFPNRKRRNLALLLGLITFIVLIYAVTIVKIKLGYGP